MPRVAVAGDVEAVAGTGSYQRLKGTFDPPEVISETPHPHLTVGGTTVIHEARADFVFTPDAGSPRVVTLVLSAGRTVLGSGGTGVLVSGDATARDPEIEGAQLLVVATGPLLSA